MGIFFRSGTKKTPSCLNQLSTNQLNSDKLIETKESLTFEKADMSFQNWYFDGYRLANSILKYSGQVSYNISNDIDTVKFYFNRRGQMHIYYEEFNRGFDIHGWQYNMMYSPQLNTRMMHTHGVSEIFSLQLTKEKFFQLFSEGSGSMQSIIEDIDQKRPTLFAGRWMVIKAEVENCISDILHCGYVQNLKKLYLQSKANELFCLVANGDIYNGEVGYVKRNADRDKLYAVKEYLVKNYSAAISLGDLCKTFGLNEFKLKKGFKELFNTTVIDFLIRQRLEQSRLLLAERNLSITEIAYHTGYSSPQHFSKAFKNRYGMSPGEFTKLTS
jgi:AraC-like DNA-binding protein